MDARERITSLITLAAKAESESETAVSDYRRGLLHGMSDSLRLVSEWIAHDNGIEV